MKFTFLNGTDGEQSSKRLLTFMLVVLFSMTIVSNLYWGFQLKETLEDWLAYLIIITFFGVAAEGWKEVFIARRKDNATPDK